MLCGGGHQNVQRALVDRLQGGQAAEVGGAHQVGVLPELYRAALLQQCGHELGAEIVVLPAERVVEIAGQRAQQIVVIALPLVVHPGELPPEAAVDWSETFEFIETAWNLPVPDARPLLHQASGEGEMLVLAGKAVKGPGGAVQADGGMGRR